MEIYLVVEIEEIWPTESRRLTNLERVHLRLDIEIRTAKEPHGLSRVFFLIFGHVEQRALRHEGQRYAEHDRREATEAGYRDHVPCETGAVYI